MYQFSSHVLFEFSKKDEIGQHKKGSLVGFLVHSIHNIYENRNSNLPAAPSVLHIHIQVAPQIKLPIYSVASSYGWRENASQSP